MSLFKVLSHDRNIYSEKPSSLFKNENQVKFNLDIGYTNRIQKLAQCNSYGLLVGVRNGRLRPT